jgi:D-alanine-D-alanine ligase
MKVAVIYNQPEADRYRAMGESRAEMGVLDEVQAVSRALGELKYAYTLIALRPPLESVKKVIQAVEADVLFNLFEGFDGRPETEGKVAGMLAGRKIPFTGCPAGALILALDKARTKSIFTKAGIPTARYQILSFPKITSFRLSFPCIVKPLGEDASHGISEESVVNDYFALEEQVRKISSLFGGKVLVEEYLDGREFNTTVIGNERLNVLAISEIVYTLPPDKPRVLTFESKWDENSVYFKNTRAVCPADISQEEQNKIRQIAKAVFRLLGCRGYARVDFRQDGAGKLKVLEINPNPDITPGAGVALQVAAAGMTYNQFIARIIRLALRVNCRGNV